MPPKKKPTPKGGARPGSGRKPGPNGPRTGTSVSLTPDVMDYLAQFESRSDKIEEIIRRSKEFKDFLAQKNPENL